MMKQVSKLNPKSVYKFLSIVSLMIAMVFWGNSSYIYAKATLSQHLIQKSWKQLLVDQNINKAKPWSWADTYPIAKLSINGRTLYILSSTSGESLSFGPGHDQQSVLPGSIGDSIIAGHRDTHFNFLEYSKLGDKLTAENYLGDIQNYQVENIRIVDSTKEHVVINSAKNRLQLITCYPFDAIVAGGPLRYIVTASVIK